MVRVVTRSILRQPVAVRTADGLDLTFWWWEHRPRRGRLIIVAPGFAQHHGTNIMRHVAHELLAHRDVLGVDFRGMAGNPGRYTFGADEQQDLQAAFAWARRQGYRHVDLIGFSLGAYISLRAVAEDSGPVERLYFVSGPTRLEDILRTGGPLRQALAVLAHGRHIRLRVWAGSQWFFRWGWPLKRKPRGTDLAQRLRVPAHFLVGGQDRLVLPRLTREVFDAAAGPKSLSEFPEGQHAEYMAVTEKAKFLAWLERSGRGAARSRDKA